MASRALTQVNLNAIAATDIPVRPKTMGATFQINSQPPSLSDFLSLSPLGLFILLRSAQRAFNSVADSLNGASIILVAGMAGGALLALVVLIDSWWTSGRGARRIAKQDENK